MADEYIRKSDAVDAVEYANGNMTWAERDDCKKRLEELSPADVVSASAYNQVMLEMDTAGWIIAILCMMLIERIRGNKDD